MPDTPGWAKNLVRTYYDEGPAHVGYQFGCVCDHCLDRADRARYFRSQGHPHPDEAAKAQSEDFFQRPWRYRDDPDSDDPPQPLREAGDECL